MEIEGNIDLSYNFKNFSNRENDIQKPFEKEETKKLENNLTTYYNTNSVNATYFSTAEGIIGIILKLTQGVLDICILFKRKLSKVK